MFRMAFSKISKKGKNLLYNTTNTLINNKGKIYLSGVVLSVPYFCLENYEEMLWYYPYPREADYFINVAHAHFWDHYSVPYVKPFLWPAIVVKRVLF